MVGLPRRTDGSLGPEASRVQKLAARLEASLGLPLVFWDERLTTRQAEQALLEGACAGSGAGSWWTKRRPS